MRKIILIIAILFVASLLYSVEMTIHLNNGTSESFEISEIDSITFCDSIYIPNYYIAWVIANPDTIYADNDETTYSEITAQIADEDGFPVPNYPVHFQTNLGYINALVITNEFGIAIALLQDNGQIGTATVLVAIENDVASVSVEIIEPPSKR